MAVLAGADRELYEGPPSSALPRKRPPYWAVVAALVLHLVVAIICIIDWSALLDLALARPPQPDAIPVTLVFEPPPAPPAPPAKPPPPPAPPQPQAQPVVEPRMSGADEKTEAKKEDEPQPALPQPKAPPVAAPEAKKPAATPAGRRERPTATPEANAVERQTALVPEPRKESPPGELFHSIRLPSQRGGTGERDTAGDAYLNAMRNQVERHRIYPPASAFQGDKERVAIYSILVDPSGSLVQITLLATSGSSVTDEAAGNMIRNSAPFAPIPTSYPHVRTLITVEMPIYPNPR